MIFINYIWYTKNICDGHKYTNWLSNTRHLSILGRSSSNKIIQWYLNSTRTDSSPFNGNSITFSQYLHFIWVSHLSILYALTQCVLPTLCLRNLSFDYRTSAPRGIPAGFYLPVNFIWLFSPPSKLSLPHMNSLDLLVSLILSINQILIVYCHFRLRNLFIDAIVRKNQSVFVRKSHEPYAHKLQNLRKVRSANYVSVAIKCDDI